jgi:RND superfamily putative drug exporter
VIALSTAGGIVYLLTKNDVIDLNGQSQGILSVLVLGAATDYALLLISRYREELHHFEHPAQAMKAALKGVFEPIVASGATVISALLVLLLSDLSGNRGLGPVGAIGVAAAVVTILTLLPALLVAFGRWIFWPRIPRNDDVNTQLDGTWAKIGSAVEKRPRKLWIVTALGLAILAGFSTTLNAKGLSTADAFTQRPDSVVGLELLGEHFPGGSGQPTEVVVREELIGPVSAAIMSVSGVSSVEPMRISQTIPGQALSAIKVVDGKVILNATLALNPDSVEARDIIPVIRDAVHAIDPKILVGGSTAVAFDTDVSANRDNRTIIPIVLILITIILSAALLLGTVVLSFFATLGACQLVFEHVFGFKGADTSFPLFAFIFLVALGIDYNIFLMTRVREESAKIGTRAGVIKGLTVTGGVITSAGIVLAATFAVLGVLPLVFLAELGFAVAFGVLLDTLIVRTILVPALVHDIGGKVWWPSKLQNS